MYRCNECGAEYDIKPDFCDCGNDTFTEVQGQVKPKEVYVSQSQPQQTVDKSYSKMTFEEQYPEIDRLRRMFDPISTAIFMICIISGLLILFLVGNPDKEAQKPKTPETPQITEEIPSIDKIWDNSTVGVVNNEKVLAAQKSSQTNTNQTPSDNLISQSEPAVNSMQAKVQNELNKPTPYQQGITVPTTQPKTQKQPELQPITNPTVTPKTPAKIQTKPQQQTTQKVQTPQQTSATQKTQTANTNNNNQNKVTQTPKPNIPKATQAAANQTSTNKNNTTNAWNQSSPSNTTTKTTPKTNTTASTTTNTNTTASKSQTTTQKTQVPIQNTLRPKASIDTQAIQKELANYKVGLRNTIGRKIDFANVIGDGDCVVSFTIASDGKLTNRKFAKQSTNITLNDAVYRAVMSTPSYNPPPSGYKNEILNLKIRFYSGNFDISLN